MNNYNNFLLEKVILRSNFLKSFMSPKQNKRARPIFEVIKLKYYASQL